MSTLFTPLTIRGIEMRNRLWVSTWRPPGAVVGRPAHGRPVHLAQFAAGGAGLVIAEATAVSPEGRISPDDVGLWNDAQLEAWAPVVAAIRARGAVAGVQLGHAGRKASTTSPLKGGRGSVAIADGGWTTVAPSAVAYPGFAEPRAPDAAGIEKVVDDFADAARRAVAAGFAILEVHAAHGYLLHQFLSPLSNHRDDEYGGSFDGRVRLLERVTAAVRDAAPDAAVFVRFSGTDAADGGWDIDDTVRAARRVAAAGADLIDVSSGGLVPHRRHDRRRAARRGGRRRGQRRRGARRAGVASRSALRVARRGRARRHRPRSSAVRARLLTDAAAEGSTLGGAAVRRSGGAPWHPALRPRALR